MPNGQNDAKDLGASTPNQPVAVRTVLHAAINEYETGATAEPETQNSGRPEAAFSIVPVDESTMRKIAKRAEEMLTTTLDGSASEQDRVSALGYLRGARHLLGADLRSDEVLIAMIDLYQTSANPAVRSDVFRQLSGVTDYALVAPLLYALTNDVSSEVREEAAETLGHFLPDAEIRAALELARTSDGDSAVREQARRTLQG